MGDVAKGAGKCADAEKQNAPKQNPAPAKKIDQISAEEPENASRNGRNVKKHPDPLIENSAAGLDSQQFGQSGLNNEGENEKRMCRKEILRKQSHRLPTAPASDAGSRLPPWIGTRTSSAILSILVPVFF